MINLSITPKFKHESVSLLKDFWVVAMISNPVRYRSRYKLYEMWVNELNKVGANVLTVELAFGERPFEITEINNPKHVQLRTENEIWHKENAINIGFNYLRQTQPSAKYFAWIDADVLPMRPVEDWLLETYHELQHYKVVQMFEWAQDLDHKYNPLGRPQQSFMSAYIKSGGKIPDHKGKWQYYGHGHPGYAWAATREALDDLGGLLDIAILGAGDRHMAMGLVGCIDYSMPAGLTTDYVRELHQWEARAVTHIRRDIGYVSGGIYHFFHGRKSDRKYSDRWKILVEEGYSPNEDLKRDSQGLYQLEDNYLRQIRLRDRCRMYMRARNEDSIEV